MRLVCPNCDAEYEVDAAAIPPSGRDVQCSNCGHAWFQTHLELEAADEAEADLYDAPKSDDVMPAAAAPVEAELPAPEVPVEPEAEPEPEPEPVPAPPAAVPSRSLDDTVLAVLREEAEREASARRAEAAVPQMAPVIETQTEMSLAQDQSSAAAAVKRIARLRGAEPEPVAPPPAPKSRREMLPAIEEINSTLRATSDRTSDEETAIMETMEDQKKGGGFRRGFVLLVGLAALIVVLYVFAPLIGAKVPALSGAATAYVAAVDAARIWLDGELRSLIGALRGLAGGQGG